MADVARLAGVGASTVSRVARGDSRVALETRRRVMRAMRALDYRLDIAARSLRTGRSAAIGFVVSDLANPVFSTIAAAAETLLFEHGYSMFVASHGQSDEREHLVLESLFTRGVEGAILSTPDDQSPKLALELNRERIPVVLLDREDPKGELDCVVVDHLTGTLEALRHLYSKGHRKILQVDRPLTIMPGRKAQEGIRLATKHLGGDLEVMFSPGEMTAERGRQEVLRALARSPRPSAVVATSNQLQAGVLDGIREIGLTIGAQIGLIGTDDAPIARLLTPRLTVLHRDLPSIGRAVAQVLLDRIRAASTSARQRIEFPLTLIERESVPTISSERADNRPRSGVANSKRR